MWRQLGTQGSIASLARVLTTDLEENQHTSTSISDSLWESIREFATHCLDIENTRFLFLQIVNVGERSFVEHTNNLIYSVIRQS